MGVLLIAIALLTLLILLAILVGLMLFWHYQKQLNTLTARIQDLEKQIPLSVDEASNVDSKSETYQGPITITSADPKTKHPAINIYFNFSISFIYIS